MASNSEKTGINDDYSDYRNLNKDTEKNADVSTSDYPVVEIRGDESKKEEKGSEDRPSLVTIKKYVYYPESFEEESNDAKEKGGKWMIYAHGSYDKLDYNWFYMKELVDNKILFALKSSTGYEEGLDLGGVTICYTSDSENTSELKMAADEIRKLIGHDEILYYKTNEASTQGKYLHENCINVTQYMYTVSHNGEGVLSKKDEYNRWCPLNV